VSKLEAGRNTALLRCVKQLLSAASLKQHRHPINIFRKQTAVVYWW